MVKRARTFWLEDDEYEDLKSRAREHFEERKGYVEAFLRKVAKAEAVFVFEGKSGELIEIKFKGKKK